MRLHRRTGSTRRRGVAAVELALVTMLFVVPMILGIWETGRLIHVQQVVANSAREGARLAGQGFTIKSDGTQVQIKKTTGNPNVRQAVVEYLRATGLNVADADVTVAFEFTSPRTSNYAMIPGIDYTVVAGATPPATLYPTGSYPPDPCYGDKGQTFTVHVSVPWEKVRWINLGILRPEKVEFTASWRMLVDDAFEVNSALPTW